MNVTPFWDPCKAHICPEVIKLTKKINLHTILIPASMTYKYQLVDVLIAAIFKKYVQNYWRAWMARRVLKAMEEDVNYRHESFNYIEPSIALCVVFANKAYQKVQKTLNEKGQIKRCADKLYMGKTDWEICHREY